MRRDADFFQQDLRHLKSEQLESKREIELTSENEITPAGEVGEGEPAPAVELPLLYLSKRLREALKIEALLTAQNIDYLVEAGPYTGGFLFRRQLTGAYFYVAEVDLTRARQILSASGYTPYSD